MNNPVKLREAFLADSKIIGSSVHYGILICESLVSGGFRGGGEDRPHLKHQEAHVD